MLNCYVFCDKYATFSIQLEMIKEMVYNCTSSGMEDQLSHLSMYKMSWALETNLWV
jgi:hypothetical protein